MKLLATDDAQLEHDSIQSGWGDAQGDAIGGKDVAKELALRGIFSDAGNYSITFKLINRDDSDAVIASKTVEVTVKETATTTTTDDETGETTKPNGNNQTSQGTTSQTTDETKTPTKMPQTGNTVYGYLLPIIMVLAIAYFTLKKKN